MNKIKEHFGKKSTPSETDSPSVGSFTASSTRSSDESPNALFSGTPTTGAPKRTIVLSWLSVAAMAALIFWMSANTGSNINQGFGIISTLKALLSSAAFSLFGHEVDVSPIGHFVEYFIFGMLLLNALRFHLPISRALVFAILIGSIYGITDELHQYFVPERSCDPMDWFVDTIATILGALLCRLLAKRKNTA